MQGQCVMCEGGVEERTCWHCLSGKLLLAVIWIKILLTQLLYKADSAVSRLSLCNLHITGSYKKCEVSTSFRESPYWGEMEFCPCQGSGCTIRADTLSGYILSHEFAGVLFLACKESQREHRVCLEERRNEEENHPHKVCFQV